MPASVTAATRRISARGRQHGARRRPRAAAAAREQQVHRRDAHDRRRRRREGRRDRRLDQQQADRVHLHRDGDVRPPVLRSARPSGPWAEIIGVMNEIDSEILKICARTAASPGATSAPPVGLSANAAADRVRRLRQAGVITGFTALVDPGRRRPQPRGACGRDGGADTDSDDFATRRRSSSPCSRSSTSAARPTISSGWPARTRRSSTSPPHAPRPLRRSGHRDHAHPAVGPGDSSR